MITTVSEGIGVRAIEIGGARRGFSSGADLRAGFDPTAEGHPDVRTGLRELYHPIILRIRNMPKPVVAAVSRPAGPTQSYAGAKRQLNARVYAGFEQQLELEARIQQQQATTADFIEGVSAFAEKRPAHFTGR